MSIRFQHRCGHTVKAPAEMAGKKAKCPHCGEQLVVPSGEERPQTAGEPIRVACASCGSKLRVPAAARGTSGECPKCGATVSVPARPEGEAEAGPAHEPLAHNEQPRPDAREQTAPPRSAPEPEDLESLFEEPPEQAGSGRNQGEEPAQTRDKKPNGGLSVPRACLAAIQIALVLVAVVSAIRSSGSPVPVRIGPVERFLGAIGVLIALYWIAKGVKALMQRKCPSCGTTLGSGSLPNGFKPSRRLAEVVREWRRDARAAAAAPPPTSVVEALKEARSGSRERQQRRAEHARRTIRWSEDVIRTMYRRGGTFECETCGERGCPFCMVAVGTHDVSVPVMGGTPGVNPHLPGGAHDRPENQAFMPKMRAVVGHDRLPELRMVHRGCYGSGRAPSQTGEAQASDGTRVVATSEQA